MDPFRAPTKGLGGYSTFSTTGTSLYCGRKAWEGVAQGVGDESWGGRMGRETEVRVAWKEGRSVRGPPRITVSESDEDRAVRG